jgi:hypothetical protein
MRIEADLEREELLKRVPELSISFNQQEADALLPLWVRVRTAFPSNAFALIEVTVSAAESLFCYVPTRKEKDAFSRINALNQRETEFLKLVREFPV